MANEHIINNNLIISGSVSSSVGFSGDGSGLTNITSTAEWDGSRDGDASITGSLVVSSSGANVDFVNIGGGVSGSFSGSYEGDGSGLTNLNPFPFSGTAFISGSLTVSGSNLDAVDFQGIDNIRGGTFSGSFSGDGFLLNNLNINGIQASGSNLSGSFSGSFEGDGSGLTNLPSQEWDGSRDGDSSITGSLVVSGSGITVELKGDTTLDENIFISNTGDSTSIGIGSGSLEETTQSRNTIAIGLQAGNLLVSGSSNVYIGNEAGESATQTVGDTAVGYQALQATTGPDTGDGANESCNTAVGFQALKANTTGKQGTAVGADALRNNTEGLCNTAVGHAAGCNITTGDKNIAIGDESGLCIVTDSNNSVIGNCAGYRLVSSDNTALGKDALRGNSDITAGNNTALGSGAGQCLEGAGSGNMYLGTNAGPSTGTTESNQLYINNAAGVPLIKGDFSTCQVEFRGGVSGSFSGSFAGDGTNITGITSEPNVKFQVFVTGSGANAINTLTGSNSSTNLFSNVLGGEKNESSAQYSSLVGGLANTSSADYSIVGGGSGNLINTSAVSSSIIGGSNNTTNLGNTHIIGSGITADKANYAYVNNLDVEGTVSASLFSGSFVGSGAGLTGLPTGEWDGSRDGDSSITGSLILSGSGNILDVRGGISGSTKITIGSGHQNLGTFTSVGGGKNNIVSNAANCSNIGGGCGNEVYRPYSAVLGGNLNIVCNTYGSIVGGLGNKIDNTQNFSFIGGGYLNKVEGSACGAAILSGCKNIHTIGDFSSIAGGTLNTSSADFGAILGGSNNNLQHNCSFIIGDSITSDKACYTFMNNLDVAGTVSASIFSGSFVGNASGLVGLPGGIDTQVQFNDNGVFGGSANLVFDGTNLTVGGKITAQEIVTQVVSQSIALATGSNIFGDELTDLHQFTGSLSITGSVVGDLSASGTITGATGSFSGGIDTNGFVILTQVSQSLNYEDDTAAAAGGVPLGGLYRNGNFIAIRLI